MLGKRRDPCLMKMTINKKIRNALNAMETIDSNHPHSNFQHVDDNKKTPELCLEAVKENWVNIVFVPPPLLSSEICLEAINKEPTIIMYIPSKYHTKEMGLAAVVKCPNCHKFLPESIVTQEYMLELIKKNGEVLDSLKQTNTPFKTFLAAIRYDPHNIRFTEATNFPSFNLFGMHNDYRHELAIEAVTLNGLALEHIHFPPPDVYVAAVTSNGMALQYVPIDDHTDLIIDTAMANNTDSFQFIVDKKQTPERCLKAVTHNGLCLSLIKPKYQTEEMQLIAVKNNVASFPFVAKKTDILDEKMVNVNYLVLQCLDSQYQTDKICCDVVQKRVGGHKFIKRTCPKLWLNLYKIDASIFSDIPIEARSEELYFLAVSSIGLAQVPPQFRTDTVCFQAVIHNKKDIEHVPVDKGEWYDICLNQALTCNDKNPIMNLVPVEKQTFSTCVKAVTNNCRELTYLALASVHDEVFAKSTLSQDEWLHIYKIAVRQDPETVRRVRHWRVSVDQLLELYWEAVKLNVKLLGDICSEEVGETNYLNFCWAALEVNPEAVNYIEDKYLSDDFLLHAVSRNGLLIERTNNPSSSLQMLAVRQTSHALTKIKKHTVDLVTVAAEHCTDEFIQLRTDFVRESVVPQKLYQLKIREGLDTQFISTKLDPVSVITERVGPMTQIDDVYKATELGKTHYVLEDNKYHVYRLVGDETNGGILLRPGIKFVKVMTCKLYYFQ